MSEATPKSVLQEWFRRVWNEGDETAIDELLAPDALVHGLAEGEVDLHGPAGFKAFWRNMRTAMPDLQIRIQDMIAEGERIAIRVVLTGTHSGDGLGVKATGRRVHVAGIVMGRVAGGKLIEGWNSWDQLGVLQQLGVVPRPEGQDRFVPAKPL